MKRCLLIALLLGAVACDGTTGPDPSPSPTSEVILELDASRPPAAADSTILARRVPD